MRNIMQLLQIMPLIVLTFTLSACNGVDDGENIDGDADNADPDTSIDGDLNPDGDITDGDTAEVDISADGDDWQTPAVDMPFSEYIQVLCPWRSACEEMALDDCLGEIQGLNVHYSDSMDELEGATERLSCLAAAASCDDFTFCMNDRVELDACPPTSGEEWCEGTLKAETCVEHDGKYYALGYDCLRRNADCIMGEWDVECHADTDIACDEFVTETQESICADDAISLWCPMYGQVVPYPVDCTFYGWVCSDDICNDAGTEPCVEDTCDGPLVRRCSNGIRQTSDCRIVDPDFECATVRFDGIEQMNCQVPQAEWECTEPAEPECDGDRIKLCAAGKMMVFDCPAALGAVCRSESPGFGVPRCVVE